MNTWILEVGEPLPLDGSQHRLMRNGILAEMLQAAGHQVTWWTSSFNHQTKQFRSTSNYKHNYCSNYSCWLLKSCGYSKNISFLRMLDHYQVAQKFSKIACREHKPDIILSGLPTIDLCYYALKYGEKVNVPVILDVQDLWPDVFLDVLPLYTRMFGKLLLFPYYKALKSACSKAHSIIGLTDNFVDWGVKHSGRARTATDRVFPLGYSSEAPSEAEIHSALEYWTSMGITSAGDKFIVVFIGTLGKQFDLSTVIDAAKAVLHKEILFIICGDGEERLKYTKMAAGNPNVIFPGWIDRAQIWTIMRIANLGIAPYKNTVNFLNNIPNKPIEYLSASLPVLTCLDGVLSDLLVRNECGYLYKYGDSQSLASCICAISEDEEQLAEYSRNAGLLYSGFFQADKVYSSLINYLEKICLTHVKK